MRNLFFRGAVLGVLGASLVLGACNPKKSAAAPPGRHPIHGVIQSLDTAAKTATIKHRDIPGFMEAMTMEFPVKDPAEFARLRTGETIDGIVFVQDTDYWVGEVKESK